MYSPTLAEFLNLATQGNLIPVARRILADLETPLSAYRKIRGQGESFLFESVEGGEHVGRYSFVGCNPRAVIRQDGQHVQVIENGRITGSFVVENPLTPSLSPSDGERVAKPGEGPRASIHKIVVSVKGGGLKADDIRSLMAVRERDSAEIGLFISLEEPTRGMVKDAASAGFYESATGKKYPRVQLLTIEGLLSGKQRAEHPDHAPDLNFKKAKAESNAAQKELI